MLVKRKNDILARNYRKNGFTRNRHFFLDFVFIVNCFAMVSPLPVALAVAAIAVERSSLLGKAGVDAQWAELW